MSSELTLEIDVVTLDVMRNDGDEFLLLDVRETYEFEAAKIDGSKLLPMSEIRERVSELEEHRDRRILVLCHHGVRSMRVTQALRGMGFASVQSVAGGIDQWSLQIDERVARY